MDKQNKLVCQTPTPGKQPTRIDRWKYDLIRMHIHGVLPTDGKGIPFKDLFRLVGEKLSNEEKSRLGSVSWYTTTVKLDLEVQREIKRVVGASPQRLLKVKDL
jgi:hypothetical protein